MPPLVQALYDGFLNGLAIPLSGEPVFYALRAFGADANELIPVAVAATIGFTLAQAVNFAIGWVLFKLRAQHKAKFYLREQDYAKASQIFRGWMWPLLMFAWFSLGGILMIAAGFFRMHFFAAMFLTFLGKATFFAHAVFIAS